MKFEDFFDRKRGQTEVVLQVAAGVEITAIITKSSSERLGLSVSKTAYAVVKASDVIERVQVVNPKMLKWVQVIDTHRSQRKIYKTQY